MISPQLLGNHHSTACNGSNSNNSNGSAVWVKVTEKQQLQLLHSSTSSLVKQQGGGSPTATEDTTSDCSSSSCNNSIFGRTIHWGWNEGRLLSHDDRSISVQLLEGDAIILTFPPNALEDGTIVNANEYDQPPPDLITLTHLHEPAVVAALQTRYGQHQIYTNTGHVLLALNPFQSVPNLYGENIQKQYAEGRQHLPPHVYSIADHAYRDMMRNWEDGTNAHQSILVSGESGSGKTVTTKFVMKYLAGLSVRHQQPTIRAHELVKQQTKLLTKTKQQQQRVDDNTAMNAESLGGGGSNKSIEAQVLQSNPILESFGNARTVRNDNSSRFGKFIEIRFDHGVLVGAVLETYLLEKVRLVSVMPNERNYHIFYQLLSDDQYCRSYQLRNQQFKLLGTCMNRRDGVSDRETFQQTIQAFDCMDFTKDDVAQILQIVAGLLHASNLTFRPSAYDHEDDGCELYEDVDAVCQWMGVNAATLQQALCYQLLQVQDTIVERCRNEQQAAAGLEALIKETYGALFDFLVKRINTQMNARCLRSNGGDGDNNNNDDRYSSIGVLDIFGFESFAVNSFEQLCINYCNEALQQQFNAYVLKNEQAEYEREGIQWSFIEFPENQNVLDLIEKRGASLLSILDDQCRAPGPSDKAYSLAVYQQCGKLDRFSSSRKQQALGQFSVHHYAGPVEYTVTGFTAKNKDELPKETILLLRSSSLPLLEELAIAMEDSQLQQQTMNSTKLTPSKRADSSMGRATVGGQFRKQLRSLRQKIDQTSPHYVRCLKPNDLLVPDHFDTGIVAEQLRCGGILEAVRVARAGFTQHYSHADFVRRYKSLTWKELAAPVMQSPLTPLKQVVPPKANGGGGGGRNFRNSYPAYIPKTVDVQKKKPSKGGGPVEMSPTEAKSQCTELIKVLYKKIRKFGVTPETPKGQKIASPVAKAKSYSFKKSVPSWSKELPSSSSGPHTSSSPGSRTTTTAIATSPAAVDYIKLGIQMGKTKVFLRHKAFEALERMRSAEQTKAATLLNSMFRRYLARIAYLPYRSAMRRQVRLAAEEDYRECKEDEYGDSSFHNNINKSFQSARSFHSGGGVSISLDWDHWTVIREAIHNPVPRHEWGKQEVDAEKFKWVIREGLWVKNYNSHNDSSCLL
jgi:myosin V